VSRGRRLGGFRLTERVPDLRPGDDRPRRPGRARLSALRRRTICET